MKKLLSIICAITMLSSNVAMAQTEEQLPVDEEVVIELAEESEETTDCGEAEISLMSSVFEGGDGSEENPFLIATQDQLAIINDLPSYCYKLVSDIELEGDWNPIGYNGDNFTGTFDGDGYTIKNLNVLMRNYDNYAGLFKINSGTIKNLRVEVKEDGAVKTYYSYGNAYAGIIAGYNTGTISNCCAFGTVEVSDNNSYVHAGGIVGCNDGGTISNCYFKGSVSGYYGGGLLGRNYNSSTVANCYAVSTVTGSYKYGFCYSNSGTITSCYYDKQVSGLSDTGKGEPKTTLGMKLTATYEGWDFENTWGIDSDVNDGYPYLLMERVAGGVTAITLNQSNATMAIGETLKLTATIEQEEETERTISWSSSDDSVASVSDGLVTANSIGSATITASVGISTPNASYVYVFVSAFVLRLAKPVTFPCPSFR